MEQREYCYDFIEYNKCDMDEACLLAHVIIPDNIKREFILKNPRPLSQGCRLVDNNKKRGIATVGSGNFHISSCITCGKGIKFTDEDILMDNLYTTLCATCRL